MQTDATTPDNVGTCIASWEGYNREDFGDHVSRGCMAPNGVVRAVQADPTLLHCASVITEQKKFWKVLVQKSDRFQQHATTFNRVCKRTHL